MDIDPAITHSPEIKISYIDLLNASLEKWNRQNFSLEDRLKPFEQSQVTESLDYITEMLKDPRRKERLGHILKVNPDLGIRIGGDNDEEWSIYPIGIEPWLDRRNWKHILVHQSFVKGTADHPFDNAQQLDEKGVWGAEDRPTYLAPLDSLKVIPNFVIPEEAEKRQPVVAYIDTGKLAEARSVWVDPEQLTETTGPDGKIQGNAFYVIGGIPAEAIINFSSKVDQSLF